MPSSLVLTPVAAVQPSAPAASAAAEAPHPKDPVQTATAAQIRPLTNPSLHLDLALNLVVLEFTDEKGDVTQTIPSQKQLKAYRDQRTTPVQPDVSFSGD